MALQGLPRSGDSFGQYCIKVSFWGARKLIFGKCVENHHQRPIVLGGSLEENSRTVYRTVFSSQCASVRLVNTFEARCSWFVICKKYTPCRGRRTYRESTESTESIRSRRYSSDTHIRGHGVIPAPATEPCAHRPRGASPLMF